MSKEKEPSFEGELGLYQPEIDPGKFFKVAANDADDTLVSHDTAGPGFEGPEYDERVKRCGERFGIIVVDDSIDTN